MSRKGESLACERHVRVWLRRERRPYVSDPQIIAPDGTLRYHVRQLPDLPLPMHVIVRDGLLWVDGWIIRVCPISTPILKWIHDQTGRWASAGKGNDSHLAQVLGIVDALETMARTHRGEQVDGEQ